MFHAVCADTQKPILIFSHICDKKANTYPMYENIGPYGEGTDISIDDISTFRNELWLA